MNKRLVGIDTVSGVMLIWMMYVVHLARFSGVDTPFLHFILSLMSCFMPWFYFKAGMFFKPDKPFKVELRTNTKRLLVPFLFFSFIGWGGIFLGGNLLLGRGNLSSLIEDSLKSFLWYGSFNGNFALWFLLSLFMVKFLFKIFSLLKVPHCLILLLSAGGVAFFVVGHFNHFLYIGNVSNGLFFFTLGVIMKDVLLNKPIILFSLLLLMLQFFFPTYLDFRASEILGVLPFPLVELSCLAGCVLFYYLFTIVFSQPVFLVTYVGKNSMRYYVVHYMIISIVLQFIEYTSLVSNVMAKFLYSAILLTIALYLFDRVCHFSFVKIVLGELKK